MRGSSGSAFTLNNSGAWAAADASRQGTWGNKVGFILLPFNIRPREDPLDYVRDIKTIMERKKASWEPFFSTLFLDTAIKLFGIKALLIHMVSYVDKVIFVISVEEETIPDPEKLCDDIQHSIHVMKNCAGMHTLCGEEDTTRDKKDLASQKTKLDKLTYMIVAFSNHEQAAGNRLRLEKMDATPDLRTFRFYSDSDSIKVDGNRNEKFKKGDVMIDLNLDLEV
ncbi:O-acyltransferase, WSD1 domain-containing protein [Tanacetum coccineum]